MQRIEPRELNEELQRGGVCVLDVRSESAFAQANEHIPGDTRHSPDQLEQWWSQVPRDCHVVTFCT